MTFRKTGFRAWKKALERFQIHEASKMHAEAIERLRELDAPKQLQQMVAQATTREQQDARTALTRIFEAVKYLLAQGLPFRRHDEETGNLQRLVSTFSLHCPELRR